MSIARSNLALALVVGMIALLLAVLSGNGSTAPTATAAKPASHSHGAPAGDPTGVVHAREFFQFKSLDSMVATSSAVVQGTVTATGPGRTVGEGHDREDYATATLEVGEVLSGEVEGATIAVEELAALDGTPVVVNGVAPTRAGDTGFFFLRRTRDGVYELISSQGRLLEDNGRLRGARQDDPLIQSMEQRDKAALRADIRGSSQRAREGTARPEPYPPGLQRVPARRG